MTPQSFPPNFLWGTASSAHQVEGNNFNNQWWAFEQQPGAIWHGDKSGIACDWWRNAEADFDLMQQMGLNAHRMSIEWSRVEPTPGRFDRSAIDRYRAMLDALRSRGIKPMLCLHHFSNPQWLEAGGAWERAETIDRYLRFVRFVVGTLGDLNEMWLTINEPQVYTNHSYLEGIFPPARKNLIAGIKVYRHMLLAHGLAYQEIHRLQPEAQVGTASALRAFKPLRADDKGDQFASALIKFLSEDAWTTALRTGIVLPPYGAEYSGALKGAFDFVGINYYTRSLIRFVPNPVAVFGERMLMPGAEVSDSGRDGPYSWYCPEGLYDLCMEMRQFGKPIYITENGLPDADDDQRPRWLVGHLQAVHNAIRDGADVRGYYHWTFTDNFEWAEGWALRFGLVEVNPETQQRTVRPSGELYRQIATANALPGE
jgi:beta-glucosidase